MPPCLAALSVGVVCPLLTHTFSEPTTIFHPASPPRRCRFLAADGPVPPAPSSALPALPCVRAGSPVPLAPPPGPFSATLRLRGPRGCHLRQGPISIWSRSTSFPPSPALGCWPSAGTVPPKSTLNPTYCRPSPDLLALWRRAPQEWEGSALQIHDQKWSQ